MKTIAELRAERRAKLAEIRKILELLDKEGRSSNTEEDAKKEALYADVASIDKRISDLEKFEELAKDSLTAEERTANGIQVIRDERDDENGKPKKVFRTFGEQLAAVREAGLPNARAFDSRLIESRAASGQSEGVGADGGFLVQNDFAEALMSKAIETGQLSSLVDSIPVTGNGLTVNEASDYDRRDGYQFGGVQAYWENEADQMTATKMKFKQMSWKLKKLTGMCYATDEMLEDYTAMGSLVEGSFKKVFGFKLDQAILWGTGTGQPLGFNSSPCLITQALESSGNGAGTFLAMNAVKMFSRLHSSARADAVWLVNADVEPQLYTAYITVGSTSYPLYTPQGGMNGYPYGTLLGRRVIVSEHAKTLGTAGDVMLVSPSQYLLITKGGVKKDVSIHVRFQYNEQAFRFVVRVDGQPKWSDVVTPAEGGNTTSPFVRLLTRT